MNIFEQASRLGLRFNSPVGEITTEDLWRLPLTNPSKTRANLDDIAIALNDKLKTDNTTSFVTSVAKDPTTQLKFDIVKYIIDVRIAERDAKVISEANKVKKEKLLALLEKKQDGALEDLSVEELRKQIEAL